MKIKICEFWFVNQYLNSHIILEKCILFIYPNYNLFNAVKAAFTDAFYFNNQIKRPNIQSIYTADNFEVKEGNFSLPHIDIKNSKKALLTILKVCKLRALTSYEKILTEEAENLKACGYVTSQHTLVKLSKLDYVLRGIERGK